MASIRDRYEDSMLAVWIHDAVQAVTGRYVYYGPNRGSAEWRALGNYVWGCGHTDCVEKDVGGFTASLGDAEHEAKDHARTHRRTHAHYYEG